VKPGFIPFSIPDTDEAGDMAREFCQSRGLTSDNAKIVRRGGKIEVEIKVSCLIKVATTPRHKS